MIIHAGEQLTLAGPLRVGSLLVRLELDRPTRIDLAGHELRYGRLEILGCGAFAIVDGPAILLALTACGEHTRMALLGDWSRR